MELYLHFTIIKGAAHKLPLYVLSGGNNSKVETEYSVEDKQLKSY